MSERRYSPLATLFAATFLFRIGNAVAALALPWFVLSHTKSAAWAGATAASSVIATIIGAWVGGGLVDRFGRAPVALISGVVGGVAMASIPLLDAVGALSNTGLIACVVLGAAFDAPGAHGESRRRGHRPSGTRGKHPRAEQTCKDGAERRQPERWRSAKQADCGPPKGRAT